MRWTRSTPRIRIKRRAPDLAIQVRLADLPRPQIEYQFDAVRRWRIDYAWPEQKLAVEIEGGFYGKGRECPTCGRREVAGHTSIQRLKTDREKYNALTKQGWWLLRFTPEDLESGTICRDIKDFFQRQAERSKTEKGGGLE